MAALGSNLKPRGKDKWLCKCPIHNDKDWAMSIKLTYDNKVLVHCFACHATGVDLYRHFGLDLDELNGGPKFVPDPLYKIKENYMDDRMIISIFESDERNLKPGYEMSLYNKNKYKFAKMRKAGAERKYPELLSKKQIQVCKNA
jgi:hypothetical protein